MVLQSKERLMVRKALTSKEVAAIGEQLYAEQIREKVEEEHRGKFLVLDIDSGDYEINERDVEASLRLLQRRPDGTLYGLRIGFAAAYRLGGSILMSRS
jgi:hypothetical protein